MNDKSQDKKASNKVALVFLGICLIGGYFVIRSISSSASAPAISSNSDYMAQTGCTKFYSLYQDIQKGLLTDAEGRTKMQDLYSNYFRLADNKEFATASEKMLHGLTSGNDSEGADGYTSLIKLCNNIQ